MKHLTINYNIDTSRVDCYKNYLPQAFMTDAQEIAHRHATAIGFGYKDLITSNTAWVLSRMKVHFLRQPKWDEEVKLTTWHKGRDGVFSLRDFQIHDNTNGELVVEATSSWLIIDLASRRMLRPDHALGEKGESTTFEQDAIAEHCQKIVVPKESPLLFSHSIRVMYSDTDMNMHTNNTHYMRWAVDAIAPELLKGREIEQFQINFNQESKLSDEIKINVASYDADSYYIEGISTEGKNIFQAKIEFKQ